MSVLLHSGNTAGGVLLFTGTTCFAVAVTFSRHVICSNQSGGKGVACLNQFSGPAGWLAFSVMTPNQGPLGKKQNKTMKPLLLL